MATKTPQDIWREENACPVRRCERITQKQIMIDGREYHICPKHGPVKSTVKPKEHILFHT